MLAAAERLKPKYADAAHRVTFLTGLLPGVHLPRERYDAVISNSLLHHLHDPQVLWEAVKRYAAPGAPIYVVDLMRPDTVEEAAWLVELYAKGEPPLLRTDFYNSLLAAFEPDEVREQLRQAGLGHLSVTPVSDRHLVVSGYGRP
jgi:SAM-dependent methyltransferase